MAHAIEGAASLGPLATNAGAGATTTTTWTAEYFRDQFNPIAFIHQVTAAIPVASAAGAATSAAASSGSAARTTSPSPSLSLMRSTPSAALADFSPQAYADVFGATLEQLNKLKRTIQGKINNIEDEIAAGEPFRRQKLAQLQTATYHVQTAFEGLESGLADVGNTAVRIGEQLETIDKQRTRASEATDLIAILNELNTGRHGQLDALIDGGPAGESRAAIMVRRLSAIAREVDVTDIDRARKAIETYSEALEKRFLASFDSALRERHLGKMRQYARILTEFNGGDSVVGLWINQHEFFMNQTKLSAERLHSPLSSQAAADASPQGSHHPSPGTAAASGMSASGSPGAGMSLGETTFAADPSAVPDAIPHRAVHHVLVEEALGGDVTHPTLQQLCTDMNETCHRDWETLQAVFPVPSQVMGKFIQRMFAQTLQNYLENFLAAALDRSPLYFVQHLTLAHHLIWRLVRSLRNLELVSVNDAAYLTNLLERCAEDLFVPYLDHQRYQILEQRLFKALLGKALLVFNNYEAMHVKAMKLKNNPSKKTAANLSAQMTAFLSTLTGDKASEKESANRGPTSPDGRGVPCVETAMLMLQLHIASARRCHELTRKGDQPRAHTLFFKELIEHLGHDYLERALEMAIEDLQNADLTVAPTFAQLPMIPAVNDILQLLQIHFQHTVVPVVSSLAPCHREAVVLRNDLVAAVEFRINALLSKQLDAVSAWIDQLLSKQRKTEYRITETPEPVNPIKAAAQAAQAALLAEAVPLPQAEDTPTATCQAIVAFLRVVFSKLSEHLAGPANQTADRENQMAFLNSVGLLLFHHLLDHVKKLSISCTGGLLLARDFALYHRIMSELDMPALTERFEMLKELGTLYIVKPENLWTVINEGHLAKVEAQVLFPFLQSRLDWSKMSQYERDLGLQKAVMRDRERR